MGGVCDLNDEDSVDNFLERVRQNFGDIDIFVGSSGGPEFGHAENLSHDDFMAALNSNFVSLATLTNKLIPTMRRNKWGRIVYVATSGAIQPIQTLALSNVSRSALSSFAKTLSNDVGVDGITVNTVIPGKIDTDRLRKVTQKKADDAGISLEDEQQKEYAEIPVRRYGKPEEFASAITYLCSQSAAYINGVRLAIDGGMIKSL
jgi:3-oxoacyl-[acyl-carrier protein] reductase